MRSLLSSKNGQSLVEILIAVGVGAIFITAATTIIIPSLKVNTQAYRVQTGTALAKELMENVRVWAEGDWHNISNLATTSLNHYYLNTSSSPFTSVSGNQSVVISTTTYTRYFYVDDVYRDSSDLIASGGSSYDPSTKKVTVEYSWPNSTTSTLVEYITRNRDNVFWQTDWSGGSGQDGPVTSTNGMFSASTKMNYTSSTGSITIIGLGGDQAQAPSATTTAATNVSLSTATLNGQANPNGFATTYWFEYGPTAALGFSTATSSAGRGTSTIVASSALTGLSPNTTYYFRVDAQNANGTTQGSALNFTTTLSAPTSLSATAASATQINLAWTNTDGTAQTRIYRGGALVNTVGAGVTSYNDIGLTSATAYSYTVRHYKNSVESADSNTASAMTLSPTLTYSGTTSGSQNMQSNSNLDFTNAGGSWTFTVNTPFTINVKGYAGGGGGGAGYIAGSEGGGGGGGGASCTSGVTRALTTGTTYQINVGAGGGGGNANVSASPTNGGRGGDTVFSIQGGTVYMNLNGGGGGGSGITTAHGIGGTASGCGSAGGDGGDGRSGGVNGCQGNLGSGSPGGGNGGGSCNGSSAGGNGGGAGGGCVNGCAGLNGNQGTLNISFVSVP